MRVHIADQPDALLVPQVALGSSQLGRFVYVVGKDGKAEQHIVSPGASYGSLIVIDKGVKEGDRIIVGNLQKIGGRSSGAAGASQEGRRAAPGQVVSCAESARYFQQLNWLHPSRQFSAASEASCASDLMIPIDRQKTISSATPQMRRPSARKSYRRLG